MSTQDRRFMGPFGKLVANRGPGKPFAKLAARKKLVEAIRGDENISTIGRRAVLWMIQISDVRMPVMASFAHREWGAAIGREIQEAADDIAQDHHAFFLACGTGFHLTHHCGGLDERGSFNPDFPANTLWMAEGDNNYPQPGTDRDNANMIVITPKLSEIGSISLRSDA